MAESTPQLKLHSPTEICKSPALPVKPIHPAKLLLLGNLSALCLTTAITNIGWLVLALYLHDTGWMIPMVVSTLVSTPVLVYLFIALDPMGKILPEYYRSMDQYHKNVDAYIEASKE